MKAATAPPEANQKTVRTTGSRARPRRLRHMKTVATKRDETSAVAAWTGETPSVLGFMTSTTPANPAATAASDALSTGSPLREAAMQVQAATKRGDVHTSTSATASGRLRTAMMLRESAAMPAAVRRTCRPGCALLSAMPVRRAAAKAAAAISSMRKKKIS